MEKAEQKRRTEGDRHGDEKNAKRGKYARYMRSVHRAEGRARSCTPEMMLLALAPLILIPSLLHYSFKAGQEKKKRQRAIYKKVDQGAGDGGRGEMSVEVQGKGPGMKRSQREECYISSESRNNKYEHRLMSLDLEREGERQEGSCEGGLKRKRKRGKYNVTPSSPGVGCEGIKGTFEEPEDDSQSAKRVVSMITRSGEVF